MIIDVIKMETTTSSELTRLSSNVIGGKHFIAGLIDFTAGSLGKNCEFLTHCINFQIIIEFIYNV